MESTSARPGKGEKVRLADYRPPAFRIPETEMEVWLDAAETRVRTRHRVERAGGGGEPLFLHGKDLHLDRVELDGETLTAGDYTLDAAGLTIGGVPGAFDLVLENRIHPRANTLLEGLYESSGMLCTQCEAEGFRRITFGLDRPDVLTRYTVTLHADAEKYPVLLCNGNPGRREAEHGGRHRIIWRDPIPKPSYLFAIVAGDLAHIEESYVTRSGRRVLLRFHAAERDIGKCRYALGALQRAMRWDEEHYGREYDLDLYNVVAVADFNMGAMENKGLNLFNIKYVLADPEIATDADYRNVESVIGHEYFHNWSGNRITCRDWFQLSLKEGFTVFRDQQFSADLGSAGVKRIEDVNLLRNHQFREDAGPAAHPVRPDSYVEINNFYTATVYNKGAEVVRMLHTLLGPEQFRRGTDLYFERFDGRAVTTDDFVAAMEEAGGRDFTQFRRWYSQAGTPRVRVEREFDPEAGTLALTLRQHCPPTPGQEHKESFMIPLRIALLDRAGRRLPLVPEAGSASDITETVLELTKPVQRFVFHGLATPPALSLLRGFSAPVILEHEQEAGELALLLAHDDDPFCRWEAGQKLALEHLLRRVEGLCAGEEIAVDPVLAGAWRGLLKSGNGDGAFTALALELPSETYIGEAMEVIRPVAIHRARSGLQRELGLLLRGDLERCYAAQLETAAGGMPRAAAAARSLRDACLRNLAAIDDSAVWQLAEEQLERSACMTDTMAALTALAHSSAPGRHELLEQFYDRWRKEPLVVDKWLRIQATAPGEETLDRVRTLTRHPAFEDHNPNKVYALTGAFCTANPAQFHRADGAGYAFLSEWVLRLDSRNPQVAARLVSAFNDWRRYDAGRQLRMEAELRRIAEHPGLSQDVGEIVSRALGEDGVSEGEASGCAITGH